jgi:flagellar basal-body rod modification protein FlgD
MTMPGAALPATGADSRDKPANAENCNWQSEYVMDTQALSSVSPVTDAGASKAATALGSDDFFKLLIAQLTNQDPLEPTSNQELLNQISSIRDIELSTNLSNSLKTLTDQQRFASASALIGRYVTGQADEATGRHAVSGVVTAIRYDNSGSMMLELDDGSTLPIEQLGSVMSTDRAAELFVGRMVSGVDRTDPAEPRLVEGLVTAVSEDEAGHVMLELDTGEKIRLSDVLGSDSTQTSSTGGSAG